MSFEVFNHIHIYHIKKMNGRYVYQKMIQIKNIFKTQRETVKTDFS